MRNHKWFALIAILSLFALIGGACADDGGGGTAGGGADEQCSADEFGCVEIAEGDPIVLGTLLVISGENAQLGQDSQNGAILGADYVDENFDGTAELLGHEITFEHQDEGCTAEGGQAGARALVADIDRIVAVVGTSCSSAALGVADTIFSQEGVVLISPSNTSPELAGPDHQPFYFRTAHNDLIQGAEAARFVSEELGHTTAATIHDGSTYANGLQKAFADSFSSEFGGEITGQEAIQVGQKDMAPVLTQIAGNDPQFLFYPVFIPEGGAITSQAREIPGLDGVDLGGADGMLSPDFIKAAGPENAEGVYLSGPDLEFAGSFYEEEFLPAYKDQFGATTSVFHAHTFDAVQIVLNAIEAVAIQEGGTTFIPRTALRDEIAATEGYEGIVGTLTCDENGDCNPGASMSVSQVVNGDFEVVWRSSE
ncbi:MAG: branched-chain amino acid ABC transporter substrate-binding protein [Actinomycetota bacterium]|nr:branched-chain amino acid ABC transporter substrate-binding protein [Actinomycetota bacterium]